MLHVTYQENLYMFPSMFLNVYVHRSLQKLDVCALDVRSVLDDIGAVARLDPMGHDGHVNE